MAELQQITETSIAQPYSNLRFEPGDHGTQLPEDQFKKGDPNAHAWNDQLINRVIQSQPKIVALDSLGISQEIDGNLVKFTPGSSYSTWLLLPATPERINPTDNSILVVDGDALTPDDPIDIFQPNVYSDELNAREAIHNEIVREYNNIGHNITKKNKALMTAAYLASIALVGSEVPRIPDAARHHDLTHISRRTFLKAAIGSGIFMGAYAQGHSRLNAPNKASNAITEQSKEKVLQSTNLTDPNVLGSKLAVMRTALLILKTKDAIDYLGLPKDISSSIIMGNTHSYGAERLFKSDQIAQAALRDGMQAIEPILANVFGQNTASKKETVGKLVEYLSQTFVLKVEEPDHAKFGTTDLVGAVDDATSVVADFISPRVKAAFNGIV